MAGAPHRAAAPTGLALLTLALAACFEEPVQEELELRLAADGTAEVAFSVLLEEVLPEEDGGRRELLHRHEKPLVEAVEQAMSDAWEVLLVTSQEAYSINEVSRLVFDPFPARVRVEVPGEVVETEGFAATPEGGLLVPSVSLWQALTSLQGRWLEPDPLLLYVDRSGGTAGTPGPGFDLAGIVARERSHAAAPRAAEIRAALETRLLPAPVYRVVYRVDGEVDTSSASR
jgi:hypothetical protein